MHLIPSSSYSRLISASSIKAVFSSSAVDLFQLKMIGCCADVAHIVLYCVGSTSHLTASNGKQGHPSDQNIPLFGSIGCFLTLNASKPARGSQTELILEFLVQETEESCKHRAYELGRAQALPLYGTVGHQL